MVGHQILVLRHSRVIKATTDQALHRKDGALGIGHALPLGGLAHQTLAIFREGDDGRRGARAFRILDDFRGGPLHHRNAAIGGAEVDTDDLGHLLLLAGRPTGPFSTRVKDCPGPT